jgi:hypothetical protein
MPWRNGPYITPWAALGLPVAKSGDSAVGNRSYAEPKLYPVLAVHVGWELAVL